MDMVVAKARHGDMWKSAQGYELSGTLDMPGKVGLDAVSMFHDYIIMFIVHSWNCLFVPIIYSSCEHAAIIGATGLEYIQKRSKKAGFGCCRFRIVGSP